jgi:hypothetical protein
VNKQQEQLMTLLKEKRLVKVISGISNFDTDRVGQVVRSATIAGAGAVDVAARQDVVKMARQITDLPVFASSIYPEELAIALEAGADVAEIGNFDALYKDGFYLTAEDVLKLTEKTLALLPKDVLISVTIPGHLSIEAQVRLAQRLEEMGVTMLQTEGASRVVDMTRKVQLLSAEEKVQLTLENTRVLCNAVSIPVMTASGIHAGNVQEAFLSGAAAVGIGSAVNILQSDVEMVEVLNAIMAEVAQLPIAKVELAS